MNKTLTVAQIEAAKEAGFYWHPVRKGLVVRHSSGSWVSVDDMLARFVDILATQQPEPRDEVADTARTARRHWNPVYNTDPVQRACTELPEGWSISACMEREAGWVDVYGPDGKEPNFEGDSDHFDWLIHQAIDFAIGAARAGGA
ncbi:hypothetical protein [Burkholderia cepacia]|uniref:hypothetical protein n=1 Tax=Burkholderia cepacia TaxID=292 RepID=UPI002FE25AA8